MTIEIGTYSRPGLVTEVEQGHYVRLPGWSYFYEVIAVEPDLRMPEWYKIMWEMGDNPPDSYTWVRVNEILEIA